MSTVSLSITHLPVNRLRKKSGRPINPSPEEIHSLWAELCALGDIAPEGRREGVARERTSLLNGVEPWRLPEILENLMTGGQPA
jgi:hypothetical protein